MVTIVTKVIDRILKKGTISKRVIGRYLPSNPVIMEAGAYNGRDTKEMSILWPKGFIHAFEPVPAIYLKLTHKLRRCTNVICYPLALAGKNGHASMYISDGKSRSSSSLLRPKEHLKIHPEIVFTEELDIETITLNDWKKRYGIDHVDFLWLDTQGTELEIMKNGADVMKTVCAVLMEVSLKEMYESGPLYSEVREWMASQGFSVQSEALPWDDMGNVLFVRK